MILMSLFAGQHWRQTQRTDLLTMWEKKWEGWIERVTLKHIHYHT